MSRNQSPAWSRRRRRYLAPDARQVPGNESPNLHSPPARNVGPHMRFEGASFTNRLPLGRSRYDIKQLPSKYATAEHLFVALTAQISEPGCQISVVHQLGDIGSTLHLVPMLQDKAAAAYRLGNGGLPPGNNGNTEVHGFHQRHAETFMLTGTQEYIRGNIEAFELTASDGTGKHDLVGDPQTGRELPQIVDIGPQPVIYAAGEYQPGPAVELVMISGKCPNSSRVAFVGLNTADKQYVDHLTGIALDGRNIERLASQFLGQMQRGQHAAVFRGRT